MWSDFGVVFLITFLAVVACGIMVVVLTSMIRTKIREAEELEALEKQPDTPTQGRNYIPIEPKRR